MKNIILAIFGIFLIGCAGNDNSQKNVALIEKYIQAVESEDYETMASLLADNYVGLGPSHTDTIGRTSALENWKNNVENLYETIKYNKSRTMAVNVPDGENKGEWVSNWAELDILYKGDKGEVTVWANTIYEISSGKIIKSYTFYNEADVLRQLGYVFINPKNL
jgi:SnoaL-like domain